MPDSENNMTNKSIQIIFYQLLKAFSLKRVLLSLCVLSFAILFHSTGHAQDWENIIDTDDFGITEKTPVRTSPCGCRIELSEPSGVPGDRITIRVMVDDPCASRVGRVDITTPEGTFIATSSGSNAFTYWWEVPDRGPEGTVKISYIVYGKTSDSYGATTQLGSGSTNFKKISELSVFVNRPLLLEPVAGDEVEFQANAYGGTPPYTFHWRVDGRESIDTPGSQRSVQSKTFDVPGVHPVHVRVVDKKEREATASLKVDIKQKDLPFEVSGPTRLVVNQKGRWDAKVTREPFSREYYYIFEWGDNSETSSWTSHDPVAGTSHHYGKPGLYTLKITVKDMGEEERIGEKYLSIKVIEETFTLAGFEGPEAVKAGDIKFWKAKIRGGMLPYTFIIKWGDRSQPYECSFSNVHASYEIPIAETSVSHSYKDPGIYTIAATATDGNERTAERIVKVKVKKEEGGIPPAPDGIIIEPLLTVERPSERELAAEMGVLKLVVHLTGIKDPATYKLAARLGDNAYVLYGQSKHTYSAASFEAEVPVSAGTHLLTLSVKDAPQVKLQVKGKTPTGNPPASEFLTSWQQSFERARQKYQAATTPQDKEAANKSMINACVTVGKAWFKADRFKEASEELKKAARLVPRSPSPGYEGLIEFLKVLAACQFRLGDRDGMHDAHKQYIRTMGVLAATQQQNSEKYRAMYKKMGTLCLETLNRWILLDGSPDVSQSLWKDYISHYKKAREPYYGQDAHPIWSTG